MDEAAFLNVFQKFLILVLEMCAPVLITTIVVGLIISIIQSVTQIQEQTLTFVPKIFAGILIAALKSGTASVFSSVMFFLCQIISKISKNIVILREDIMTELANYTPTTQIQEIYATKAELNTLASQISSLNTLLENTLEGAES